MCSKICIYALILSFVTVTLAYLEMELQRSEQTSSDTKTYADYSKLVVKRINKTKLRGLSGTMTYHYPMDNSFKVKFEFYLKQGGEYRKLPYKFPEKGICNFFNEDRFLYPDLAKNSDFPKPLPCPVPVKAFTINNFVPSLKEFPTAMLNTGDYKAEIIYWKDNKSLVKWNLYLSIIRI